jgi:hypothetical protein
MFGNVSHYYRDTVVVWLFYFVRRRLTNTPTARYCGNLGARLVVHWQKVMEIKRYFKEIRKKWRL